MTRRASTIGQGLAGLLFIVPILFLLCGLGAVSVDTLTWLETWGSGLAFSGGALLCGRRALRVRDERSVWTWFTVACFCWTGANLYAALVVFPAQLPLPSPADLGYFSFPVAISLALLAYARHYARLIPLDTILDALIITLTLAAIASGIVFNIIGTNTSSAGAFITTVLYPSEDLFALGLLIGVACVFNFRWSLRGALISLAILLIAVE